MIQQKFIDLVWVCAWCGTKKYPPLKKGQTYTHGICVFHKKTRLIGS